MRLSLDRYKLLSRRRRSEQPEQLLLRRLLLRLPARTRLRLARRRRRGFPAPRHRPSRARRSRARDRPLKLPSRPERGRRFLRARRRLALVLVDLFLLLRHAPLNLLRVDVRPEPTEAFDRRSRASCRARRRRRRRRARRERAFERARSRTSSRARSPSRRRSVEGVPLCRPRHAFIHSFARSLDVGTRVDAPSRFAPSVVPTRASRANDDVGRVDGKKRPFFKALNVMIHRTRDRGRRPPRRRRALLRVARSVERAMDDGRRHRATRGGDAVTTRANRGEARTRTRARDARARARARARGRARDARGGDATTRGTTSSLGTLDARADGARAGAVRHARERGGGRW